jgi:hypothetical protein
MQIAKSHWQNFLILDWKILDAIISEDPEKNLENLLISKKLPEILSISHTLK